MFRAHVRWLYSYVVYFPHTETQSFPPIRFRCVSLQMLTSAEGMKRRRTIVLFLSLRFSFPTFHTTADRILEPNAEENRSFLHFCLHTWSEALFWFLSSSRRIETTLTVCKRVKVSGNFLHEAEGPLDWAAAVRPVNEGATSLELLTMPSPAQPFFRTAGGELHFWYLFFL